MRTLIRNHDLKRLFAGAAIAAIAGLTTGAAIQPALDADGVHAPQQLMGDGGVRTYVAGAEPGVGGYQGQVPDYVIGTDWMRPQPLAQEVLTYDDRAGPQQADDATTHGATANAIVPRHWQDEPRPAPLYPSEGGATSYGADLPAPPEPPSDEAAEPAAA